MKVLVLFTFPKGGRLGRGEKVKSHRSSKNNIEVSRSSTRKDIQQAVKEEKRGGQEFNALRQASQE